MNSTTRRFVPVNSAKERVMKKRKLKTRTRPPRILLVTADVELRTSLGRSLSRSGYDVARAGGPMLLNEIFAHGHQEHVSNSFDLLMCDCRVLDAAAVRLIERMLGDDRLPPIVLLRAGRGDNVDMISLQLRAAAVINNFDNSQQLSIVRQMVPLSRPAISPYRGPP